MTSKTSNGTSDKRYDLVTAEHDYAPWAGPPRRTILICTHQRSGSTLLGEALHYAGGLGCPLEYYHSGFRPSLAERWQTPELADYAAAVTAHRTDPSGTLAVKLFWVDVVDLAIELDRERFAFLAESPPDRTEPETYRALAALLAPFFPAPVYVHLSRRDRLRQAISTVAAADTGRWRSIPDVDERAPAGTPRFDLDRIERLIGYADFCHAHWRNFFTAIGAHPHVMTYEELAGDYSGAVAAALRFLGSDATPAAPRMQRQADEVSEAIVLQFLRARAAAAATPH